MQLRSATDKRFSESSGVVQLLNILAAVILLGGLFAGISIIINASVDRPSIDLLGITSRSETDYSLVASGVGVILQALIASAVLAAMARVLVILAALHEKIEWVTYYSEQAADAQSGEQ